MLLDEMKTKLFEAMKAKDTVAKEILRVAMGEIQIAQERSGDTLDDAAAGKLVRKLIKSNEETIGHTADEEKKATLARENEILGAFLPKTLSVDEIVAALAPVEDAIKAAGNDGQATGAAMKHLKPTGANVSGGDVAAAVKQIRGG